MVATKQKMKKMHVMTEMDFMIKRLMKKCKYPPNVQPKSAEIVLTLCEM